METNITSCAPKIVRYVPDELAAEKSLHHSTDGCAGRCDYIIMWTAAATSR